MEKKFKFWSVIIGVVLIGATSFLGYKITDLRFDYDFEKFFPANDDDADYFYAHRKKFEADNNFLLIAVQREKGVFDRNFLNKVERFRSELSTIKYVKVVRALTNQEETFINSTGGAFSKPYLNLKSSDFKEDSIRIYRSEELINTLISKDGTSLCVFLKHEDVLSKKKSDYIVDEVERISKKYNFEKVRMAGTTAGQKYYIYKMNFELILFAALSGILIVLFLFIAFRSGWGIIVPQVVIVSTVVWVLGGMGLFDTPMNILLTTLPSILFVVSMSDVIHLVSRYLDALRENHPKFEAIIMTLKEVGLATFLTSFTTSIGFLSLYFVNVQPVKTFGLVVGIGVMIAYLLTILCLPILFYYTPAPKIIQKQDDSFWTKRLPKWYKWIIGNGKRILIGNAILVGISLAGIYFIEADNLIMDDISEKEQIKQDFNYLDTHFGGFRPFELAVTVKDTNDNIWNPEYLETIDKVENYLENVYGVELKNTLVLSLKVLNRSSHAGNPSEFKLPEDKRSLKRFRRFLKIAGQGQMIRLILDSTERVTRITGGIGDWGNNRVSAKNEKFRQFLKENNLEEKLEFRLTGSAYILDKNISYLSMSLLQGLLFSILIVAGIMGLIYKSLRMMIISIIPNVIPLMVIGGLMGFTGLEIKTSTAIIFTIAFGIAVDDTIHLLGKFKFELMKGKSKMDALQTAFLVTGKAMILTTLILCSGFMLLLLSSFNGTFNLGFLLSITLFVALILDLTLLPVLIMYFYKEPKKKSND
jgi:predicted RND superfamily exporter protein